MKDKIIEILKKHESENYTGCENNCSVTGIYEWSYESLLSDLESLKEEREENWINVKDDLPYAIGAWYMVYTDGKRVEKSYFYNSRAGWYTDYGKVTHWQPLLDPPIEKQYKDKREGDKK